MTSNSTETDSKVIGVLTSGGDAPGMNAIIRAVVRIGLFKKFKVFLIYEGFNGLLKENLIKEANLFSVDHIIHKGGTFIGSSRCAEFREKEGRIKAALTLIKNDINHLVIIGGDGSLTGANILRKEWTSIVDDLALKGQITEEMKSRNLYLNIVGIVGSIDNDFCNTEMTTGVDTALHRIVESVDAISTTANSHQRAMIIEVMGRNCGYLALVSAIAVEATYTFLPESPPSEDWPQHLSTKIEYERKNGRRLNIIIVSEGALDLNGNPITSNQVLKIVKEKTKRDTRLTILGHIQRGGRASAYDCILGSRMGATAVTTLESTWDQLSESVVLAISGNAITGQPLMECVEKTHKVAVAMKNRQWDECVELRGKGFTRNIETFKMLHKIVRNEKSNSSGSRFGVIQVGEPCPGMNAAVLSFVRFMIAEKQLVFGVRDGVDGLIGDKFFEIKWSDVNGWTGTSGALLGTSKVAPNLSEQEMSEIAKHLKKYEISGMLVIGGFRAFQLTVQTTELRQKFTELKIPFCIIPATIDNNIPGSAFSVGTDSAVNKISELCTDILISSRGTKRRLFIIKLETGFCGYLTLMSALACGADYCYTFEDNFTVEDVKRDANNIAAKMTTDHKNRIIIVNGMANKKLLTKTVTELYTEVGNGVFTTHFVDLANLQQRSTPTPFDRNLGIKLGIKCADWLLNSSLNLPEVENAVVIGITGKRYLMQNIKDLIDITDFEHEMPKEQWYRKLKDLVNLSS